MGQLLERINMRKTTSFDEFDKELNEDAEYRKTKRKIRPYYDRALEIIKRRIELGFTQEELAEKAHTFQSRISKIESGEYDIRLSTLIDIAEALQCEIAKNILVPIDVLEFDLPKNKFEVIKQVPSILFQPAGGYINVEDYQYA
jgi:transcriptional regulator with XRE-family HTH domain